MSAAETGFVPGIKVEVSASIEDPEALGHAVAHLDSQQQARFLLGLAEGFRAMGFGDGSMQIRHWTDDTKTFSPGDRETVRVFLDGFTAHMEEVRP